MTPLLRLAPILALVAAGTACADPSPQRKPGDYPLPPEALQHPGVARGTLEGPLLFKGAVFPGIVHRYWIFVPAQYRDDHPANLLVFQDGQRATNPQGPLRVQHVLENMVGSGEIPVTIGLFITPGQTGDTYPDSLGMGNPNHRAEEYDSLGDDYSRFLIGELLPEVERRYRITDDPAERIIGGTSSGAICAFTVAWRHPDQFGNVLSMIGSYTAIAYRPASDSHPMVPGGELYPTLIRTNPVKPLSIFLQDGSNDLSNEYGNWFLSNQQMLSALEWANAHADENKDPGPRYRINHVWGDGSHSDTHGGSLLPDMLRWAWGSTP